MKNLPVVVRILSTLKFSKSYRVSSSVLVTVTRLQNIEQVISRLFFRFSFRVQKKKKSVFRYRSRGNLEQEVIRLIERDINCSTTFILLLFNNCKIQVKQRSVRIEAKRYTMKRGYNKISFKIVHVSSFLSQASR